MESWQRLDLAAPDEARDLLRSCCGASAWVERMMARRPFGSHDALWPLRATSGSGSTAPTGSRRSDITRRSATATRCGSASPRTAHLSEREQAGVDGASEDVLEALAEGNREYERRFGYIFIVCASGKSADEMLVLLRAAPAESA